jgi:hypothetical protein
MRKESHLSWQQQTPKQNVAVVCDLITVNMTSFTAFLYSMAQQYSGREACGSFRILGPHKGEPSGPTTSFLRSTKK